MSICRGYDLYEGRPVPDLKQEGIESVTDSEGGTAPGDEGARVRRDAVGQAVSERFSRALSIRRKQSPRMHTSSFR